MKFMAGMTEMRPKTRGVVSDQIHVVARLGDSSLVVHSVSYFYWILEGSSAAMEHPRIGATNTAASILRIYQQPYPQIPTIVGVLAARRNCVSIPAKQKKGFCHSHTLSLLPNTTSPLLGRASIGVSSVASRCWVNLFWA